VAEALQYIHSEGIVHGDLRGVSILHSCSILPHFFLQENILLDPSFRSQVADFGLTRHCDITLTRSTWTFSLNFAAPELLGICLNCDQILCSDCGEGGPTTGKKTHQTDVYAFGCLYYQVSFSSSYIQPLTAACRFILMLYHSEG
jgi:serine/threonine protein kinase